MLSREVNGYTVEARCTMEIQIRDKNNATRVYKIKVPIERRRYVNQNRGERDVSAKLTIIFRFPDRRPYIRGGCSSQCEIRSDQKYKLTVLQYTTVWNIDPLTFVRDD